MTILLLIVFFLNRSAKFDDGFLYIVAGLSLDAFIMAAIAMTIASSIVR